MLIVEDDELNLKLLKDLLDYHGYDVTVTGLGNEAVKIARTSDFDLILLDIRLPDVSGMEVARQLKMDEQTRNVPIIAVTAFAMRDDEQQILRSGCDAYLSKPISISALLRLAAQYMGTSATEAQ